LPNALCFRSCKDGLLVFDGKSGRTSLVSPRGAMIVQALSSEFAVDEKSLLRILQKDAAFEIAEFDALITSLENSGLITRC